jgi:hypothetical protein
MNRGTIETRFALSIAVIGVLGYAVPYAFLRHASQETADVTGLDGQTVVDVVGWAMQGLGFAWPPLIAAVAAFAVAWIGRPAWDVLLWFTTAGVLYMIGLMFFTVLMAGGPHSLASFGLDRFVSFTGLAVLGTLTGVVARRLESFRPPSADAT